MEAFPFALSNNPAIILISPGNSNLTYASIAFILLPSAQTSGSELVTLNVTAPSGLSVRLQRSTVTLTKGYPMPAVGFSLSADSNLAPADYPINVVGTSGSVTETLSFTVSVVKYLVIAQGNVFSPQTLTVKAGSTVYWLNLDSPNGQDPELHNIIVPSISVHSPDIRPIPNSGSFSFTFTTAGTYSYFCAYHAGMKATITVTAY